MQHGVLDRPLAFFFATKVTVTVSAFVAQTGGGADFFCRDAVEEIDEFVPRCTTPSDENNNCLVPGLM